MKDSRFVSCAVFGGVIFGLGIGFLSGPLAAATEIFGAESPSATTDGNISGPLSNTSTDLTQTAGQKYPRLQLGFGWPDLRLRVNVLEKLDVEAKTALGEGVFAYGGRLYWRPLTLGPVDLVLGGGGGGPNYSSIDTLDGTGDYFEAFAGAQYSFMRRVTILVDLGPAWVQVASQGHSLSEQQWVIDTALYLAIF